MEVSKETESLLVLRGKPGMTPLTGSNSSAGGKNPLLPLYLLGVLVLGGLTLYIPGYLPIFVIYAVLIAATLVFPVAVFKDTTLEFDKPQRKIAITRKSLLGTEKKEFQFGQIKEVEIAPAEVKLGRTDYLVSLVFLDGMTKLRINRYVQAALSLTKDWAEGDKQAQAIAEKVAQFISVPVSKKSTIGFLDIGSQLKLKNAKWV